MHSAIDTETQVPGGFVVDDDSDPDRPIGHALTPLAEAEGATRRASERLVRAAAMLEGLRPGDYLTPQRGAR
jgi:hypothetical protein